MELTNGHAGGDGVWVDDEVWHNAVLGPGHVLLRVGDANGALLPMPTGKLVTHLWYPDGSHLGKQHKGQVSHAGRLRAVTTLLSLFGTNKGASNV